MEGRDEQEKLYNSLEVDPKVKRLIKFAAFGLELFAVMWLKIYNKTGKPFALFISIFCFFAGLFIVGAIFFDPKYQFIKKWRFPKSLRSNAREGH